VISPDARVLPFRGMRPVLGKDVFVAPFALVIGDVIVGDGSSIWYQTVVRGDLNFIRIGRNTNLQDACVLHVTAHVHPVRIGHEVSVGHGAIIHGATIADGCLIGMGATIMDGAQLGEQAMVGAHSLVPPGMEVPPRSLVLGSPGRVKRSLSADELRMMAATAEHYRDYARLHAGELGVDPS